MSWGGGGTHNPDGGKQWVTETRPSFLSAYSMKIQIADSERIFRLFVAEVGEHWDEISQEWFREHSDTLEFLTPEEIPKWLRPN